MNDEEQARDLAPKEGLRPSGECHFREAGFLSPSGEQFRETPGGSLEIMQDGCWTSIPHAAQRALRCIEAIYLDELQDHASARARIAELEEALSVLYTEAVADRSDADLIIDLGDTPLLHAISFARDALSTSPTLKYAGEERSREMEQEEPYVTCSKCGFSGFAEIKNGAILHRHPMYDTRYCGYSGAVTNRIRKSDQSPEGEDRDLAG